MRPHKIKDDQIPAVLEARKTKSRNEVAVMFGCSPSTIKKIEKGLGVYANQRSS